MESKIETFGEKPLRRSKVDEDRNLCEWDNREEE